MAEVSIAILGLGRVGTSVGLALKRHNMQGKEHQFTITGYDGTSDNVKEAKTLGAIDESAGRPEIATQNKDIVLMALPYGEVRTAYEYIAPSLRSGVVILDTSPICQTSLDWSKEFLPKDAHVVCIRPIVNSAYVFDGVDEGKRAKEDMFDGGTILMMPSVTCIPEAISLATDFTKLLGATPHFTDPAEHDGLIAGMDILPDLLGTAYFHMLSRNSGWTDLQRLGNPAFGMATHPLFDTHPDDLRDSFLNSGDNLVRYLDGMIEELREFRTALATQDRDALEAALGDASKQYERWINRRVNNKWQGDEMLDSNTSSVGGMMSNMMGGFFGGRNKNDDD